MKFSQRRLEQLHQAAKKLNELNLGDFCLADRVALYNKDDQVEAIAIRENQKYVIELINEEELTQAHVEEINKVKEVEEDSRFDN
jgi:hypothetical protein